MPTTRYVATTGNDADPGSFGSPKLTVDGALTVSAAGDTVEIRAGVYTDTWSASSLNTNGLTVRAYQGEDVTIDCQGVRSSIANAFFLAQNSKFIDLKFVNYTGDAFFIANATPCLFKNCFFRGATNVGTIGIRDETNGNGTAIENCTFVDNFIGVTQARNPPYPYVGCIFKGNTANITGYQDNTNSGGEQANLINTPNGADYNAFPGNTVESHPINTSITPVVFNDEPGRDFSLPPGSFLRGLGPNGSNIGASFNPRVYLDSVLSDLPLSSFVNDDDYYDTGMAAPGPDGPPSAGPIIFDTNTLKIDNVTVPGATSARAKVTGIALPAGAVLTTAGWSGEEDESLLSGSKQVIDSTAGTATRTIQIVVDAGSKQTITKNTFINQSASTVDIFITLTDVGV